MAADVPFGKLRAYLRELKPEARVLLLGELERAAMRGQAVPGSDLLLQELRREVRKSGVQAERISHPARAFFAPVEPFLVDDAPERALRGRIVRASLAPVWQWIGRDLMPSEAKAYSDQIARLLLTNDRATCDRLARAFQDQAVCRIRDALHAVQDDVKARQRLAGQVGSPRALEDLSEIVAILRARDALAVFASRLPAQIANLADEQLDNIRALLESPIGAHPDVFVYALILVMGRLAVPEQLVRLAIKAAETDDAAKVAGTRYAVAVSIVLGEIERNIGLLRGHVKRGQYLAIGDVLKDIHDAVRLLRTEMDLSGDSPWARQLAGIRGEVSDLLTSQIDSAPGRVRRLLRSRRTSDIAPGAVLDPIEVEDTEALVEFVAVCRNHASELAINEVTLRVYSELQNYLETGTSPLLDSLRAADDASRAFRLSQVDAAARFAAKVFGPSYAALLAKAADVAAAQGSERKAGKG
jgi:hypothetical protein